MEDNLRPLHRSFGVARRLLWWQRGLLALARSLCAALALALTAAFLAAWQLPQTALNWLWLASGLIPLAGLAIALALRPSRSQAARAVDLHLGLRQQLGTAEELLSRGSEGRLTPLQIARASELAAGLELPRAFPLLPKREAIAALLLAAATALMIGLVSRGMILPNPFSAIHLPSLSREAPKPANQDFFGNPQDTHKPKAQSPAVEQINRLLDQIQKQAQQGTLSSAAASAALAAANSQLNQIASESRNRQQALDNLANSLQGTAAGRDAAQSLRQGNYSQAADQIRQMGQHSDQLSPQAKQELANALNSAASQSQSTPDLAESEKDAANRLQSGDYSSVVQSTDQLAQSVQKAADQRVSQSELANSWQRLQQINQQYGQAGAQNSQSQGMMTPPVAQAAQGASERRSGLQQQNQQPGNQGGQQGFGEGPPQRGGNSSADRQNGGGSPGNSRGGPPLGNPNPQLGPDGKPLDVQGQIAGQFPGEAGGSSEPPAVLRQGQGNSIPSTVGGGADGPLSVPPENVFVPGERRPTVRDYFNGGSGG